MQWVCGDDPEAKQLVIELIDEIGYLPVGVGGLDDAIVMEAPRRPGSVYSEEYRDPDVQAVIDAIRSGRPIPPTPSY